MRRFLYLSLAILFSTLYVVLFGQSSANAWTEPDGFKTCPSSPPSSIADVEANDRVKYRSPDFSVDTHDFVVTCTFDSGVFTGYSILIPKGQYNYGNFHWNTRVEQDGTRIYFLDLTTSTPIYAFYFDASGNHIFDSSLSGSIIYTFVNEGYLFSNVSLESAEFTANGGISPFTDRDKAPRGVLSVDGTHIEFEVDSQNLPLGAQTGVRYELYSSKGVMTADSSGQFQYGYGSFAADVPMYDTYTLEVSFYAPIPFAPLGNDWHTLSVPVVVDGSTYIISTDDLECSSSGQCLPPDEIPCSSLYPGEPLRIAICQSERGFDFGLISPSINAIRKFFMSFIITSSPQCSALIPDLHWLGSTIPTSDIVSNACTKASVLRQQFPIIGISANFVFAVMFLVVVVRAINRLLDNNHHNAIEAI